MDSEVKKTDVGQIQIGNKRGSSNKSITESADAYGTAGEPQASKRPRETSDDSSGMYGSLPSVFAHLDSDLANLLESEEFSTFYANVQNDPTRYKLFRDELVIERPYVKKMLSECGSGNDPLLYAITRPDDPPLHPYGHAYFRMIQSEQFQKFRSEVLAQPHMYKDLRRKFDAENPYDELHDQDPLRDRLLIEIIDSVVYDCDESVSDKLLQIVKESKAFECFMRQMETDPGNFRDHIKVLLMRDPFVMHLLHLGILFDEIDNFKELSFAKKVTIADHSDPESPAYISKFREMLDKNPTWTDDEAIFYLHGVLGEGGSSVECK